MFDFKEKKTRDAAQDGTEFKSRSLGFFFAFLIAIAPVSL